MMRKTQAKLLLILIVLGLMQVAVAGQETEKILTAKAMTIFRAMKAQDWKALQAASAGGKVPVSKEEVEAMAKSILIIDDPKVSNFRENAKNASIRLTFSYPSDHFEGVKSRPFSYDVLFTKTLKEWRVSSAVPTMRAFLGKFVDAGDPQQETSLIEREVEYLKSWESIEIFSDIYNYWPQDDESIQKYGRLFDAIIKLNDNPIIKGEGLAYAGLNLTRMDDYAGAEKALNAGLALGTESRYQYVEFLSLTGLSEVRAHEGQDQQAIELFNKFFPSYSKRPDTYRNALWAARLLGNVFFNRKNYVEAQKIYLQGLATAENFKDATWQINFLTDIGDCSIQLREYDEAKLWYEKTLALVAHPQNLKTFSYLLPALHRKLATIYERLDQPSMALAIYKKAIEAAANNKVPADIGTTFEALAKFYASQDDAASAIRTFERCWSELIRLRAADELTDSFRSAGSIIAFDLGQASEMERLLAKWTKESSGIVRGKNLSALLGLRASLLLVRSRFRDAEPIFRQITKVDGGNPEEKFFAHLMLALLTAMRQQPELAFGDVEKAIEIGLQSNDKDMVQLTKIVELVALVVKHRNDPEETTRRIQASLVENKDNRKITALIHLLEAAVQFLRIAEMEDEDGSSSEFISREQYGAEIDSTLRSIEKSLSYSTGTDEGSQMLAQVSLMFQTLVHYSTQNHTAFVESIDKIAGYSGLFVAQMLPMLKGLEGDMFLEQRQWEKARLALEYAIGEIEKNDANVFGGLRGKFIASERNHTFYKKIVKALLNLNRVDEALSYAEKTRGGVILELNEIRQKSLTVPMTEKVSSSPQSGLVLPKLTAPKRSWTKFEDFLPGTQFYRSDAEEGNNRTTKINLPVLDIEKTKNLLPDRDAVFVEFLADDDDVYAFVLADAGDSNASSDWRRHLKWKVFVLGDQNSLKSDVRILKRQIQQKQPTYEYFARRVYDALLKPLEKVIKNKPNWILVPDDFLWDVPFQVLRPEAGQFLIYDHNISFATSLNVMQQMRLVQAERPQKNLLRTKDILAIGIASKSEIFEIEQGDPLDLLFQREGLSIDGSEDKTATKRRVRLPSIPGSRREIAAISNVFGEARVDQRTNPVATKDHFLKEAGRYRVVHIATHGLLNTDDPLNSALVFGEPAAVRKSPAKRTLNDGVETRLLTTREILDMQMNAELVVLSACNTATGGSISGEGLVGLSWAFGATGVPTVVSSKWAVNDEAAIILMGSFYSNLKIAEGLPPRRDYVSQALRKASIDLMKKYPHPYYWASFMTIGEP